MDLPEGFKGKYEQLLGPEVNSFLEAIEEGEEKKGFRLNSAKPEAEKMLERYEGRDLESAPFARDGYLGKVSGKSPLYTSGYVYSQEPSAMIPATIADVKPGERILDLCAAPGGKTLQLASALKGDGILVANEIVPKRARELSRNVERWGITNALVTNYAPRDLAPHFPEYFDCILVDAPCSEEGMFRKNRQARKQWTPTYPQSCAKRQREILDAALPMLKPGGRLIYSTCTYAPEEDEEIVSSLVENDHLTIEPIHLEGTSSGRPEWGSVEGLEGTIRVWPQDHQGEGHYVAKLRKPAVAPGTSKSRKKRKKGKLHVIGRPLMGKEEALWEDFAADFPLEATGATGFDDAARLWVIDHDLYYLAEELAAFPDKQVVRRGLHLGTFLKKRFQPSFSLAMAYKETDSLSTLSITEEEWRHYLAGETLRKEGDKGWVLLLLDAMPVAFGKQVKGVVKNFYPKGLRQKI